MLVQDLLTRGAAMRLLSALIPLATSRYRPFQIFDGDAISSVKQLREVFDERFASPRESHPDRFSWDPWHVTRRAEDAPTARVAAAKPPGGELAVNVALAVNVPSPPLIKSSFAKSLHGR